MQHGGMYRVTINSYASNGHRVVELFMPEIFRRATFERISRGLCDALEGELSAKPKIGMILGRIIIKHVGLPGFGERLRKALVDQRLNVVNPEKFNQLAFAIVNAPMPGAIAPIHRERNGMVDFLKANFKRLISTIAVQITSTLGERIGLFWLPSFFNAMELFKYVRRFWREGLNLDSVVETALDALFAFGLPALVAI